MKRLSASLLVAGLAFTGTAFAQSSGYYGQEDRYNGSDPYPSDSYSGQSATYDYARVLRVDPVIGSGYGNRTSQQSSQCYYRQADDVYTDNDGYYNQNDRYQNDRYQSDRYDRDNGYYGRDDGYRSNGNETNRTVATVIGGIAGAVLGSKIGDGSGRYVGTAVGSMVGGMAGRSIYDSSQRNRQYQRRGTVRVCDPVPVTSRDGYGDGYGDDESLNGYYVTYEYANRTYHTRTNYHPGDRIRVRVDVQAE